MIKMMRRGKALGTLDWETDVIYLMNSAPPEKDKKFLKDIKEGKFIKKEEENRQNVLEEYERKEYERLKFKFERSLR